MYYEINGGNPIKGRLADYSAKNCVLALLAASVLCEEEVTIERCDKIVDVVNMVAILNALGCRTHWKNGGLTVDASKLTSSVIPDEYAGKLRGSVFLLGALLGRTKHAQMAYPGGCAIGKRPIDIHIDGLRRLGAEITETDKGIICNGDSMRGNDVYLRFPSVGATENLLLASVLAKGTTVLFNCAREPEVTALEKFLVEMGADIKGIGESIVTIKGVEHLCKASFMPIPDRIVASTYLLAVCAAGGNLTVTNLRPTHMHALLELLKKRCKLTVYSDAVTIVCEKRLRAFGEVSTRPYPYFPTDVQSLLLSASCAADGVTVIKENLFENRLSHNVGELMKMGADIRLEGNCAKINGVEKLHGETVSAKDLRGGAGLIIAALSAKGKTCVLGAEHVMRGYSDFEKNLASVGADIRLLR